MRTIAGACERPVSSEACPHLSLRVGSCARTTQYIVRVSPGDTWPDTRRHRGVIPIIPAGTAPFSHAVAVVVVPPCTPLSEFKRESRATISMLCVCVRRVGVDKSLCIACVDGADQASRVATAEQNPPRVAVVVGCRCVSGHCQHMRAGRVQRTVRFFACVIFIRFIVAGCSGDVSSHRHATIHTVRGCNDANAT